MSSLFLQLQCQIFATTYNPNGIRAGNKILRQRLKGPCLASYYPPRVPGVRELQLAFDDLGLEVEDEDFEDRLEHLQGFVAFSFSMVEVSFSFCYWGRPY